MAVFCIVLFHAIGTSHHLIAFLYFLKSFQGSPVINEIVESVEHEEGLGHIHDGKVGKFKLFASFVRNLLAAVRGSLRLQCPRTVREKESYATCSYPFVHSNQIGCLCTTTGKTVCSNSVGVNFLTGLQIVNGAAIVEIFLGC